MSRLVGKNDAAIVFELGGEDADSCTLQVLLPEEEWPDWLYGALNSMIREFTTYMGGEILETRMYDREGNELNTNS